jgi:tetratricopeptide (TPR) repeat protein
MVTQSAVHSHNVAKEVVLVSERKGHILPVHLEPTVIPPTLKYQLAGIQHVEYFKGGDSDANLKSILRSLERIGVTFAPPQEAKAAAPAADPQARAHARPLAPAERGDLAMTCDGLGRPEEARAARARVLELLPNYLLQNPDDSRARMLHAIVLAGINRKDEALREGDKALEMSPDDPLILYNCACLYARLGESQRAIEALRQGISKGYEDYGWMRNDPDLASLRDNPDFIGLTRGA